MNDFCTFPIVPFGFLNIFVELSNIEPQMEVMTKCLIKFETHDHKELLYEDTGCQRPC